MTTIVFTNEGAQIPQKKLEMIFERFYRADDSRSSKTGGSGLGSCDRKTGCGAARRHDHSGKRSEKYAVYCDVSGGRSGK